MGATDRVIPPRLTPAELRRAGEALYGPRWQCELARALGVSSPARLREWLSGARSIPLGVRGDLVALLRQRGEAAANVADVLATP
jgi:hypothetical protein